MYFESLAEANEIVFKPGMLLQYKRFNEKVLDLLRKDPHNKLPDQLLVMYLQNKESVFYPYITIDDPFRVVEYFNPITNQYSQYTLLELLIHHDIHEVLDEMTQKHYQDDRFFQTFLRYPLKNTSIFMVQNMVHAKPERYIQYIEKRESIDTVFKDALAHASTSSYQWRSKNMISYKMPAFYSNQSK